MENTLIHYGTPKMQKGVRRYQNKDGTWTELGKERRRKGDGRDKIQSKIEKIETKRDKLIAKREKKETKIAKQVYKSETLAPVYAHKAAKYRKKSEIGPLSYVVPGLQFYRTMQANRFSMKATEIDKTAAKGKRWLNANAKKIEKMNTKISRLNSRLND